MSEGKHATRGAPRHNRARMRRRSQCIRGRVEQHPRCVEQGRMCAIPSSPISGRSGTAGFADDRTVSNPVGSLGRSTRQCFSGEINTLGSHTWGQVPVLHTGGTYDAGGRRVHEDLLIGDGGAARIKRGPSGGSQRGAVPRRCERARAKAPAGAGSCEGVPMTSEAIGG